MQQTRWPYIVWQPMLICWAI